jgi:peptidoglycan/LPS O-acetylase OafA/YrhL
VVATVSLLSIHGDIWQWILPADLLFALIVLTFAQEGGFLSRMLRTPLGLLCGQISFSIYMTHPLALRVEALLAHVSRMAPATLHEGTMTPMGAPPWEWRLALVVALTMIFSSLTFRWIEEPARQWSRRQAARIGVAQEEYAAPAA